jgi:hypothetical protein
LEPKTVERLERLFVQMDLNGNGISTLAMANGVQFDLLARHR